MYDMAYTIEKQDQGKADLLIIRLNEPNLTLAQWQAKALTSVDKEALALLVKEECNYQLRLTGRTPHVGSMPLYKIHISPNRALIVLQQLALTHKLYFNGKQLVADFYGQVEFYYTGELNGDQSLAIEGRLKWRDTDISLSECSYIGAGSSLWFIRGVSLKLIATAISWKEVYSLYQKGPLLLSGPQKAAFLEEIEEEVDGPKLFFKGASAAEAKQDTAPLPLLMLTDRAGAFANLWMDYGSHLKIMLQSPQQAIKDTHTNLAIKRQIEAEKNWEKDLLETDFVRKPVGNSHYYCPTDKVTKSLLFLLEIGWQIQDWKGNRVLRQSAVHLNLEETPQAIQVRGRLRFEDYEVDIANVTGAFNRRESFIQLSADTVGLLSTDQEYFQEIAENGEIIGETVQIKKNHFGNLSSLFEQAEVAPALKNFREKIQHFTSMEESLPTSAFQGNLRPYQQQGLNWLVFLHDYSLHGILADDMGLGKTVQVLAFLSRLQTNVPHLIVMPNSLLFNWKKEIQKFLPSATYVVHQGPQRTQSLEELNSYTIILTSYSILRLDSHLFKQLNYHCVILDEAQVIKNPQTQIAQTVYGLDSQFRLGITGTPIENNLNELWSQFHFLMPDLLGPLATFQADVEAGFADKRYFDKIKRKIAPFILRRTKHEVLQDLPARIDQAMWIEMEESQRSIYEQFLAGYKKNLIKKVELEGVGKHRMEILEAILRLRQICCHPQLVSFLMEDSQSVTSAKFDALEQDLETVVNEGSKALVYSQFTPMLKMMAKLATSKGWNYNYLDGSTVEREKVIEEFQNNPQQSLFFISLKAGGVGLNLTAADYVFLYDPWWNEALEEQAISRAHRMGRQEVVIAKRLLISDSIEEKIMKLKASKRVLIEQVLDDIVNPSSLTLEDLQYLLS